jgi:DMSO/TMAO reductase YedYZ molybdopterin-dependent catalytic subunit
MGADLGNAEKPDKLSPDICVGLVGSSGLGRDPMEFTSVGGGYRTTVSLKDLENPRVLLAYGVNGDPIEAEYGGPLRMVIPNLWGYKSCKWLGKIEFINQEEGGYWEDRGYTRSGLIEPGFTLDINTQTRRPIQGGEVTEF